MPFTPSHVAVVLPGRWIGLPLSALAIGAMAPDIPHFLPWHGTGEVLGGTHRLAGVVGIDLLLGLLAFVLWHGILAAPLVAVAPRWLRSRLPEDWTPGLRAAVPTWGAGVLVVVGLVVGSASHVVWDAFTHLDSWGPQRIAVLREEWIGHHRGARIAQYASGVIGLAVVAGAVGAWVRRTPPRAVPAEPGRWLALVPIVGLGAVAGLVAAALSAADGAGRRVVAFQMVTVAGCTVGIVGLVVAVAWQVRTRSRSLRPRC